MQPGCGESDKKIWDVKGMKATYGKNVFKLFSSILKGVCKTSTGSFVEIVALLKVSWQFLGMFFCYKHFLLNISMWAQEGRERYSSVSIYLRC